MDKITKDSNDTVRPTSFEADTPINVGIDNNASSNTVAVTTLDNGEKLTLDKSNPIPIFHISQQVYITLKDDIKHTNGNAHSPYIKIKDAIKRTNDNAHFHYIKTKSTYANSIPIQISLAHPHSNINPNILTTDHLLLTRDTTQYCNVIKISPEYIKSTGGNIIGPDILLTNFCVHKNPYMDDLWLYHNEFCPKKGHNVKFGLNDSKKMIFSPIEINEKLKIPLIKMSILYFQHSFEQPSLKESYPRIYDILNERNREIFKHSQTDVDLSIQTSKIMAAEVLLETHELDEKLKHSITEIEEIKRSMEIIVCSSSKYEDNEYKIYKAVKSQKRIIQVFCLTISALKNELSQEKIVEKKLYDLLSTCHEQLMEKNIKDIDEDIDKEREEYTKDEKKEYIEKKLQDCYVIMESLLDQISSLADQYRYAALLENSEIYECSNDNIFKFNNKIKLDLPNKTTKYLFGNNPLSHNGCYIYDYTEESFMDKYFHPLEYLKSSYYNNKKAIDKTKSANKYICDNIFTMIDKLIAAFEKEDNIKTLNIPKNDIFHRFEHLNWLKEIDEIFDKSSDMTPDKPSDMTSDRPSSNHSIKKRNKSHWTLLDLLTVKAAISLNTTFKFKVGVNAKNLLIKNIGDYITKSGESHIKVPTTENFHLCHFISAIELPQDLNNPIQYNELFNIHSTKIQKDDIASKYMCSSHRMHKYNNETLPIYGNDGSFIGLSALFPTELHISNSKHCTSTLGVPLESLEYDDFLLSIISYRD